MTRRMLIDSSHAEQTRVVIMEDEKLLEFDTETGSQSTLKGNIYLAKITRVEPSLQAAFVDYGGNRHGFLPFSEIHPDYYRIPVADREALLAEQARSHRSSEFDDDADTASDDDDSFDDDDVLESNDADADDASPEANGHSSAALSADTDGNVAVSDLDVGSDDADDEDGSSDDRSPDDTSSDDGETQPRQRRNGRGRSNGRSREDRPEQDRRSSSRTRRAYTIQDVIKRGQIMLVQVVKEERGSKGAAVTTYLSLAGRYCVLMPNTARGGGISRKITVASDRKRLKSIVESLEIPGGMAVIVRTAGIGRTKPDIKRDFDYLAKTWEQIREVTLQSRAPALIYEESQLIKRVLRDSYSREIEEVLVEGEEAYREAKDFMKTLMPSHAKRVQPYRQSSPPLFHRFKVDAQLEHLNSPIVQLRSGGYLVINLTEALVAIDINSGRATRERHIEETALKTNLEAADEIARQLRLRDLAGLVVIDFIDMEDRRNNAAVERRFKDALRHDRARVQTGRISQLGLLEMSRQRLRPSLLETMMQPCPHCAATGRIHSTGTSALYTLRALEDHGLRGNAGIALITTSPDVAFHILNDKRADLARFEKDYNLFCRFQPDATLIAPDLRIEMLERAEAPVLDIKPLAPPHPLEDDDLIDDFDDGDEATDDGSKGSRADAAERDDNDNDADNRRRGRRGGRRRRQDGDEAPAVEASGPIAPPSGDALEIAVGDEDSDNRNRRRRRRRTRPEGKSLPGVAVFAKSALPLALHIAAEPAKPAREERPSREERAKREEPVANEGLQVVEDRPVTDERPASEEKPAPRRRSRRGSGRSQRRSSPADEPAVVDAMAVVDASAADTTPTDDQALATPVAAVANASAPTASETDVGEASAESTPEAASAQLELPTLEPTATPSVGSPEAEPVAAVEAQPEPEAETAPEPAPIAEPAPEVNPVTAEVPAPVVPDPTPEPEPEAVSEPETTPEPEPALAAASDEPKRPPRRGWWQRLLE